MEVACVSPWTKTSTCTDHVTVNKHCLPELVLLALKCRPFYLRWEFSDFITAIYIPLDATAKLALGHMLTAINGTPTPRVSNVSGDFNHVNLKTLPNFASMLIVQPEGISCLTVSILTSPRDTEPLPSYSLVWLIICYCSWPQPTIPLSKNQKPNMTTVKTWSNAFHVFPNWKPWMTKVVKDLWKDRNVAFRSGERTLKRSQVQPEKSIKQAKAAYKEKTGHFNNKNLTCVAGNPAY